MKKSILAIFALVLSTGLRAQFTQQFGFGAGFTALTASADLTNNKNYFTPQVTVGLEYKFKAPISLALQPTYSYCNMNELYGKPTWSWFVFGTTYHYTFETQTLSLPLMVSYYGNREDDEKSWIFSVGAGLNLITSLRATCQSGWFFGPFNTFRDTAYSVTSLSPGNMATVIKASITKKIKTKKSMKPYLRLSYFTNADPYHFPAALGKDGLFYIRPNYVCFEIGWTIKNQAIKREKVDPATLQGQ